MASPDLEELLGGPRYIGPVAGVKQEYQVFRTARGDYVVFNKSNRGGSSFHATFVQAAKAEALIRLVPKGGATSGALLKEKKVTEIFPADTKEARYFEVLTTLYVLAAMNSVEISKSGRNLVFTRLPGPRSNVAFPHPGRAIEGDLSDD